MTVPLAHLSFPDGRRAGQCEPRNFVFPLEDHAGMLRIDDEVFDNMGAGAASDSVVRAHGDQAALCAPSQDTARRTPPYLARDLRASTPALLVFGRSCSTNVYGTNLKGERCEAWDAIEPDAWEDPEFLKCYEKYG